MLHLYGNGVEDKITSLFSRRGSGLARGQSKENLRVEDYGYGRFSDHTTEEGGVCSSESSLFRRVRDMLHLYGNGVEDKVTSLFSRRGSGLARGQSKENLRVERYLDVQKFQDFGTPSAPPIARDGEVDGIFDAIEALRRQRSHQWRIYWLKMFMSFLRVRKIRVVPQRPKLRATSSFRNLYMQAGREYVKQISKILKSQVTILSSTSSTYFPEAMELQQRANSSLHFLGQVLANTYGKRPILQSHNPSVRVETISFMPLSCLLLYQLQLPLCALAYTACRSNLEGFTLSRRRFLFLLHRCGIAFGQALCLDSPFAAQLHRPDDDG
ncbi:uncharacterized protein [Triticum aestivum]|uniref:uncharacterized protein n=1 Tax=Triticum aestivum TaxID=4565 RepID=UPI001D01563E|nr:uncharacterized protein LOC123096774 [Triticum aestivum]